MRDSHTKPIRVVLIDLTGLTCEIVKKILTGARDVEVIGEFSMRDFGGPERAADADVAIVAGDGSALRRRVNELLALRPLLKVLAVVDGGREGALYELRPHRTPLGELSAHTLLGAVRTEAAGWA